MLLFGFLTLYTWNMRTGYLNALAERSGLEATSYLLRPGTLAKEKITGLWQRYLALVDVAEENTHLREQLRKAEEYLASVREEQTELLRLRALLGVQPPAAWSRLGSRVLAGRFGPAAAFESIMIDKGFASGASPGTPVLTQHGVVGRVFRSSPHAATVQLLTDRNFRMAVITQNGRVPGVLAGMGPETALEVRYIPPNAQLVPGELLITSGLDGEFPKGVPVAKVTSVAPSNETLFQVVQAQPLAQLAMIEEVLLLISPDKKLPKAVFDTQQDSEYSNRHAAEAGGNATARP